MNLRYVPTWALRAAFARPFLRYLSFATWWNVMVELWRREAEAIACEFDPPAHPCAPPGGVN